MKIQWPDPQPLLPAGVPYVDAAASVRLLDRLAAVRSEYQPKHGFLVPVAETPVSDVSCASGAELEQ
jgi:hypothetical protein